MQQKAKTDIPGVAELVRLSNLPDNILIRVTLEHVNSCEASSNVPIRLTPQE